MKKDLTQDVKNVMRKVFNSKRQKCSNVEIQVWSQQPRRMMKTTVTPPWNTNTFPWMTYGISSLNQQYLLHHLPIRASALSVNEGKNENIHTSL